ncbi:MAG: MoaD/ThiS family protein [Anaerolineae bacterium]|jgi:molybdopterin converting factor small subunit|nr:MoaD/ThiS family protein [Anaerolineae bacterium]
MRIHVRLFAGLNRYVTNKPSGIPFDAEIPEGATVEALIRHLGLPPDEVRIVFVNGRAQPLNFALADGDEVGIFPPIGGG